MRKSDHKRGVVSHQTSLFIKDSAVIVFFLKPGRCVWLVLDFSEIIRRRTQLRTEEKGEEEAMDLAVVISSC